MRMILVAFIAALITSCNSGNANIKEISQPLLEGKLVYDVTVYDLTMKNSFEIIFNKDNVRINRKSKGTSMTLIYEKASNEILSLYTDFVTKQNDKPCNFFYLTPDELWNIEGGNYNNDVTVDSTKEYKEILGYKCRKIVLRPREHGIGEQETVEVWMTDRIVPGLKLPQSPLNFNNVVLEYESKVFGETITKFVVRSISIEKSDSGVFEQTVPDSFYMVVPTAVFSLDTLMGERYLEETYSSMSYPFYGTDREDTKEYLKKAFSSISEKATEGILTINFSVLKSGDLSDISIYCTGNCIYKEKIKKMLTDMPNWTPAMVKGKPTNAYVSFYP